MAEVIGRPLLICLKYLLRGIRRRPATVLYPFEKIRLPYQWRGLHRLDDGKCTGCGSCSRACPNLCIEIVQVAPRKKRPKIDIGRCLFCGYCVDVCPFGAMHMTGNYELAVFSREELIYTPDRLAAVQDVREGTLDEELWRRVYRGEEIPPWPPLPEKPAKGKKEGGKGDAGGAGGGEVRHAGPEGLKGAEEKKGNERGVGAGERAIGDAKGQEAEREKGGTDRPAGGAGKEDGADAAARAGEGAGSGGDGG
ncbi:MAG: NADH-quinone oxidoreductase subunit I [Thermoplasmata archaeon]